MKDRLDKSSDLMTEEEVMPWEATIQAFKTVLLRKWMMTSIQQMGFLFYLMQQRKVINCFRRRIHSKNLLKNYLEMLDELTGVLGLSLEKAQELLDADIEQWIEARETARKTRDFATADQIRDQLKEQGVILEDTPQGVRWKRGQMTNRTKLRYSVCQSACDGIYW